MATSHHQPMMRAEQEWTDHGTGAWDYTTNADALKAFWTEGIQRNGSWESIVTVGMRGKGDEALSTETNVALLATVVADQRQILQTLRPRDADAGRREETARISNTACICRAAGP
jgi:hypothetical protein